MKNQALLITSLVLATNIHAFTLPHQLKTTLLKEAKTEYSKQQSFAGNWAGFCDGEEERISIKQDAKHITFDFPDMEPKTNLTFTLNTLGTNHESAIDFDEAGVSYAKIQGNQLRLLRLEIGLDKSHHGMLTNYVDVSMRREGNILILEGDKPEEDCNLSLVPDVF